MKKRLIFDLDFFRMNHKAFRAILLKIAIKNGLLVSDAGECKKICVSGILNNLLKGNWNANYRSNPRSASC